MKKLLLFIAMVMMSLAVMAQSGNVISYQAVVRDANNRLVTNESIAVTIQVLDAGDNVVYTEIDNVTSNANGLISLIVGDGNPTDFAAVNWSGAKFKTTVHVTSFGYEVESTTPVTAVPLAFYATNVDPEGATITAVYNKMQQDSLALANRIYNDSTALQQNIDTAAGNVRTALLDTASAIRGSIPVVNNATLTIQKNSTDVGTFTANQSTDKTINIEIPTTVAELTGADDYAKVAANNAFTGTNTVPRGFVVSGDNATDATNCNNIVVNACDMWAIFDSLNRRITTLEDDLEALKSATPPTVSVSLSEMQYTSLKATATASGNGANVTSYKFCISTSADMSGATCFTSTSNEYTFTGLEPYTTYFVKADATNMVGTTTSDVVSGRTAMHAPTGSFTLASIAPKGFNVVVSGLDFKEPGAGTVQICYKKNDGTCPTDFASYTICDDVLNLTASHTDTTRKFINVDEAGVEYCVIVKLTNEDSTTILEPLTINTGAAISLDINYTPTTLNLCGGSLDVTYTATTNPSNVDLNDFENFTWSEGAGVDNSTTVTYSTTGTKTITCTATHKTEGYTISGSSSVDVINTGSGPTFSYCIDDLSLNITNITSGATTLNWGDGSAETSNPSTSSTHDYATDGIYSLVATNGEGCSTTKQAAVGIATLHPCTVSSINANEQGSGTTIETLQDVDGNSYAVVQVGKQCWMKSNLRTTHYGDGTEIANGTGSGTENTRSHTTAYYYHPTASSNFGDDYDFSHYNFKTDGLYYNWKAVMHGAAGSTTVPSRVQGVCPDGWHVPSVREWDTLFAFVQTLPNATYWDLHSVGYVHTMTGSCEWTPSSSNNGSSGNYKFPAWNSSELSIVPAGEASTSFRYNTYVGPTSTQEAIFWTTNAANSFAGSPQALACEFYDGSTTRRIEDTYTTFGHSVRCVRDYGEGSPISDPGATSENVIDVDRTTATLKGTVINPDNISITSKGFEWKLSTATDFTTVTVSGDDFTYNLTGLTPGTSYTYRAFVEYTGGTIYGNNISFTTITLPTVTTDEATSVGETVATLNGTLANPDNLTVTSKGFEWKQSSLADYTQTLVDGDDFTLNLTGLLDGTEYTFRAFMIFENNIEYGVEKTFSTITSPTVATDEATAVEINTATLNGSITNPDNVALTSKGFEWKLSTAADYTTETVTGDGLTYNLTSLSEGTTYNYRAFIVYAGGTVYGNEVSFTTKVPTPTLTITPDPASGATVCSGGSTAVTYTASLTLSGTPVAVSSYSWSAPSGKQYTSNGNTCKVILTSGTYTVTCTATPVVGDPVTETVSVTVSSISGTTPTFYTCEDDGNLSVTIKSPSNVASYDWGDNTTSTDNDHLYSSDGVYIVSAINGSCTATKMISVGLATTRPCTVTSHHTDNAVYTSSSGGLETENSEGKVVSVQDQDGHSYAVVQIGSQCWMKSNLRTTKYSDGTNIPNGTRSGSTNLQSSTSPYFYKPISGNTNVSSFTISTYNEFTDGVYYNWIAAMNGASSSTENPSGVQGVCPKGWHLPSNAEWTQMKNSAIAEAKNNYSVTYVQNSQPIALFCGGFEWENNTGYYRPGSYTNPARNYSCFTAVPTGYADNYFRYKDGSGSRETDFWSSSQYSASNANVWRCYDGNSDLKNVNRNKNYGYSVRCVRDAN